MFRNPFTPKPVNRGMTQFNFSQPDLSGIDVEAEPIAQPQVNARPRMGLMDYYNQVKSPFESRIKEYISSAPKREDYQPSKMGRLGAILSGFSTGFRGGDGFGTAQGIVNQPFDNAMQDYGRQGENLNLEVQLDNQRFERAGKLANEDRDTRNEDREYDLRAKQVEDGLKSSAINRKVAERQYGMMGFQRVDDVDGNAWYQNPFSGQKYFLGKTDDSSETKFNRAITQAKTQGQIQFGNSAALARLGSDLNIREQNNQGQIQEKLIGTRATADVEKKKKILADKIATEPSQVMKSAWMKLQQAAASDPDLYNYYEVGTDGSVRPVQGADLNKYNNVKAILSGGGGVTTPNSKPDPFGIR